MTDIAPLFPSPQRDLEIDLATEVFSRASNTVSAELESALARAASLVDSKRTRAAAAALERLQGPIDASLGDLSAPVTGLRAGLRLANGDPVESERLILAALVGMNRTENPDPVVEASLLNNLGIIAHRFYQNPAIAEERFDRAIEVLSDDETAHEDRLSRYHRNLGLVRDALGDFAGAASAYRNALTRTGEDPAIGLNIVENLALSLERSGQVDEAESYLEAAFLNLRTWQAEYPRLFMRACDDISLMLLKKGDFDNLRGIAEQQAGVCLTLLPSDEHWRAVQPLTFVALAQWLRDEVIEVGQTLRHILSLRRENPKSIADPAAIVGGLLELSEQRERSRRLHAIKSFHSFVSKLSL